MENTPTERLPRQGGERVYGVKRIMPARLKLLREPCTNSTEKASGKIRREDFLWQKGLALWKKDDLRVLAIRQRRIDPNKSHVAHKSDKAYDISFDDPEAFANLLITLCTIEGYLLDQFLKGVENRFVQGGGFRENLFRKRLEYRKKVT